MEYIRQWKVGDRTFDSKTDAQRYNAALALDGMFNVTTAMPASEILMSQADEVIALLKPFATPRTRKPRATNGTHKGKGKTKAAQATTVHA